ncbi:GNAT family protein [Massilia sp. W12]|uniref:GNAT family N-acetyltransferase n=1 Tax=Massilia sp. W12 TaxID=3126507 RepID=UPI0030D3E4B3
MDSLNRFLTPVTLEGEQVRLLPLAPQHAAGLAQASSDGRLWELWYTSVPHPDRMAQEIDWRLNEHREQRMLPFALQRKDNGALCGMSTYLHLEPRHRRLEIGATWLAKSAQGSGINTEAKFLLLQHAFEQLDCIGVELRTHFMNHQSRAAIERLGAKLDGVLRSAQIMPDGTRRDTVVYSILDYEWPTVRQHLRFKLMRRAQSGDAAGAQPC